MGRRIRSRKRKFGKVKRGYRKVKRAVHIATTPLRAARYAGKAILYGWRMKGRG